MKKPNQKYKEAKWYPGCRCAYCSVHIELDEATVDHIIPLSRGGTKEQNNMTLSCISCNRLKGDIMPNSPEMLAFLRKVSPEYRTEVDARLSELTKRTISLEREKLKAQKSAGTEREKAKRYAEGLSKYNGVEGYMGIADVLFTKY